MLGEAKKRTVVMQKTSTTSRSNQSDAKKGILVKQKLSTPPVNMLEEGKKVNEVYQKPSAPQDSVLKDEKEVTMVEKKPFSPPGCMEGVIDEVTVVEQNLSTPPGSMLVEGKKEDQNKMRRDGTNKLNPEMVPEKTLRTPKVKASPKSSSHLQSRLLSNEEDKKEVVKPADSALVKLKFMRGKIVDLQQETSSPRRMTFRWGRHVGESQDNNTRKRIFKKKGVDGDKSNTIPISRKFVWRHQDVQEKKDMQSLLNNVIEETISAFNLNWEIKLRKNTISFSPMEVVIVTLNQWVFGCRHSNVRLVDQWTYIVAGLIYKGFVHTFCRISALKKAHHVEIPSKKEFWLWYWFDIVLVYYFL
ncbi:hypothetical protein CQW23_31724 [Capsicum baccatum]|uniref:Calmodulin-binding domain-containing protein n=1 Tax=Capsicum baccatum TaxID=33114 RepID=A0A2G2V6X8_CAPBA|nr:hypothetical protein CQW23_31724 [Capsicum baccatum]